MATLTATASESATTLRTISTRLAVTMGHCKGG
jgi:hypothetical protein